ALILDERWNGGGFTPEGMIALLSRPLLNYWARRGAEPTAVPGFSNNGPKATLINGEAGSGGDAFPYYFRELGLGPLIRTRPCGGSAGPPSSPALLDGGIRSVPTSRVYTKKGKWTIENEGVPPDIEVTARPEAFAQGHDPSLERAIAYLMDELKKNPPKKV